MCPRIVIDYGSFGDWQEDRSLSYAFCDVLEVDNGKTAPASGWGLHHAFQAWGKYWNETIYPSCTWLSPWDVLTTLTDFVHSRMR